MSEDSQVTFGEVRFPVSTTVLMGTKEEPLVVERIWPGGRSEKVRVINPERSSQIPTFIFWDETVTSEQVGVIHEAFDELLSATGLEGSRFYYYGNWRDEGYKDASGKLVRFRSIEWQLNSQWNKERH